MTGIPLWVFLLPISFLILPLNVRLINKKNDLSRKRQDK
jgi:hypothetical protein